MKIDTAKVDGVTCRAARASGEVVRLSGALNPERERRQVKA